MTPDFAHALLSATLAGSLAIVFVLALRAPLRRAFGAEIAYLVWVCVPLAAASTLLPVPTQPVDAVAQLVRVLAIATPLQPSSEPGIDIAFALVLAWAAGGVAMAALFAWQQRCYMRRLGPLREATEPAARIVYARSADGVPALVGAWRPRIVVPADFEERYTRAEQALILAHEDVHRRRGDALANLAATALRCLNWFNPLLHYAAARFRYDQELACDAAVIARFPEARRCYADAMLKTQLIGQSRQELRLPVGCRWPSDQSFKERILMLKQSRPARAMRATGIALVACGALAFAYAAWASQSPRPAAVSANGQKQVDATLRVDVGSNAGKPVRIVNPLGKSFEIADDDPAAPWRATLTASGASGGNIELAGVIRSGDRILGSPSVVAKPGKPFSIAAAGSGDKPGYRIQGTLAFADGAPHGSPESASAPTAKASGDVDASYRSMAPPKYPADAVKNHVQAEVFVKVAVAADGSVKAAQVDHIRPATVSAGALGESAVIAVKSWRFNPAVSGGKPVASDVIVPITFSLDKNADTRTPTESEPGTLDAIQVDRSTGGAG